MIWRILAFVLLTQVAAWGQQISGGGSSSITAGTTATSGCTDTAVLESRSSLVTCDGALLAPSGGPVTVGNGGNSTCQLVFTPNSGNSYCIGMANGGGELIVYQSNNQQFGVSGALVVVSQAHGYGWTNANNVTGTTDVSMWRQGVGVMEIGTTAQNASGSLLLTNITPSGTITNTGISSDATHTDTTVCQDTTSHTFYSGSGTAGICLGNVSSIRFKDAWKPLDDGLSVVMALTPGTWRYKAGIDDSGARLQTGFLAEDYAAVLPDWTRYDAKGQPNGTDLLAVLPQTVRAIQQLKADNDSLRAEFNEYKKDHP
jgi:hypothetical protein